MNAAKEVSSKRFKRYFYQGIDDLTGLFTPGQSKAES